jgi:integrase
MRCPLWQEVGEVCDDFAHLRNRLRNLDALEWFNPHTDGPLDKAAILRCYRRALKAAQLEQSHRFHDLRHTFGTAMAGTGVPA